MKSAVDTILDEVTGASTFFTSTEIYAALTDGQNEVINKLLAIYRAKRGIDPATPLPPELASISTKAISSGASSAVQLYTGSFARFLELISAKWDHDNSGTKVTCKIITPAEAQFRGDNTFLAATATDPIVWIAVDAAGGAPSIIFRPVYSTTGAYDIDFLDSPTDIAAGVNAELPINTHSAIVEYAVARMLFKDQRPQEAQIHYNLFLEELKLMVGV